MFFLALGFWLLSSQSHKSPSPTGDLGSEITELIKCWKYKILNKLQSVTPFENVRNKLIDKVVYTNELISVSRNLKVCKCVSIYRPVISIFDHHEPVKP